MSNALKNWKPDVEKFFGQLRFGSIKGAVTRRVPERRSGRTIQQTVYRDYNLVSSAKPDLAVVVRVPAAIGVKGYTYFDPVMLHDAVFEAKPAGNGAEILLMVTDFTKVDVA